LAKVVKVYGQDKTVAGFKRYISETPSQYANAANFAEKAGIWINGDNGSKQGQLPLRGAFKMPAERVGE
jgi:hypothetical protein